MNFYLEGLLALLTDERHPQDLPGRRCRQCFIHPILSSPLGPRATFHSNAAPSHDRDSVPWEGLGQSPRVAPIPKRNLNDLPFVSINFRKGHSSCFSRRTHILLSEGDTLG